MLSLEEALEKLLSSINPIVGEERVSLANAAGRFLAQDVAASHPLPVFDNSAMDGWAVRSADVAGAAKDRPVILECIANVPAGKEFVGRIEQGRCARIFTGAPLMAGADAVVMQEDTRAKLPHVEILDSVKPWENVRFRGEDVKQGAIIAHGGSRLNAQTSALLSACGIAEVIARRRVRVGILATGDELKGPGATLQPGEIFESNRTLLATLIRQLGAEPIDGPIVRDDLQTTIQAIQGATEADMIVTCGGVSVGEHDFVKEAITKLGGLIDFWRVAIKPGKPFMHARVFGKPLFGLPGNPVSALVTFWLLVRPAVLKMAGARDFSSPMSFGKLAEEISNRGDRRHFVRVMLDGDGNVRPSGAQASHRLASLAAANALLDVPAETTLETGRTVKLILLP
jgi:molybdopterin molybdotransferase